MALFTKKDYINKLYSIIEESEEPGAELPSVAAMAKECLRSISELIKQCPEAKDSTVVHLLTLHIALGILLEKTMSNKGEVNVQQD